MTQERISLISSIVTLITGIATFVTASATIFTARQIKKQREASYRPELALIETHFHATDSHGDIPSTWSQNKVDVEKGESIDTRKSSPFFNIRLYNVGFGAAKNIAISWDFPVEETVKHVNALAQRALQPAYHKYDKGIVSLDSTKFSKIFIIWENERRGERIGYLLPAHFDEDGVAIKLSLTFIHLSSCYLYFAFAAKMPPPPTASKPPPPPGILNIDTDVPPITLNISFDDISGETHHTSFNLSLQLASVTHPSDGTMNFDGYITDTKPRTNTSRAGNRIDHALYVVGVELRRIFGKAA